MSKLSRDDALYYAGLTDGEGTIGSVRVTGGGGDSIQGHVEITNSVRGELDKLQAIFGGGIHSAQKRKGWKVSHQWRVTGRTAKPFLEQIEPFLRIKRNQAILVLSLIETVGTTGVKTDDRTRLLREVIHEKLAELNKRGVDE